MEKKIKPPILNETKPLVSKRRQNRRFLKWHKTSDFENENKVTSEIFLQIKSRGLINDKKTYTTID